MKKILSSMVIVTALITGVVYATNAHFSDTETSDENVLQAGAFDLLINDENDPEQIVNIDDLKPGDLKLVDKKLTIQNPAYVWIHLIEYQSSQGQQTTPEDLEENGIPKFDIENYLSYDLSLGDKIIIASDSASPFTDVFSCWIPLGEIDAGDTTVTQSFHFDSDVTNWAQGDLLTFSEEFYAEQVRNNPNPAGPLSESGRIWSSQTLSCNSSLVGEWDLVFTCTSGCTGIYPHTMSIATSDVNSGNFTGTGYYNPTPAITWDILNANAAGSSVNFRIDYNNINSSYFADLIGTIDSETVMHGTAISNAGQTFTWEANKL